MCLRKSNCTTDNTCIIMLLSTPHHPTAMLGAVLLYDGPSHVQLYNNIVRCVNISLVLWCVSPNSLYMAEA